MVRGCVVSRPAGPRFRRTTPTTAGEMPLADACCGITGPATGVMAPGGPGKALVAMEKKEKKTMQSMRRRNQDARLDVQAEDGDVGTGLTIEGVQI